jgi:hypothetical protein
MVVCEGLKVEPELLSCLQFSTSVSGVVSNTKVAAEKGALTTSSSGRAKENEGKERLQTHRRL